MIVLGAALVALAACLASCLAVAPSALAAGSWSAPAQVDHAGARAATGYLVSCPSPALCVGVDGAGGAPDTGPSYGGPIVYRPSAVGGAGGVLSFGLSFATDPSPDSVSLIALRCPSAALCLGVGVFEDRSLDNDDVFISSTPAAGASSWIQQRLSDPPTQLSCPSTAFCAGAGQDGGVVTTADPVGGASAWTTTTLAAEIVDVDCPSPEFCAAIDVDGDVWTSTDPTGGVGAWTRSGAPAPLKTTASADDGSGEDSNDPVPDTFSCSGPDLCVAAGPKGSVLESTDPAGAAAWSTVVVSSSTISAVACPAGGTLCLAGDGRGEIATSSDGTTWTSVQTADSGGIGNIACGVQQCVASPEESPGVPLLVNVPSAGGGAGTGWQWHPLAADVRDGLSSVSCPAPDDCLGADQNRYYASADPARGAGSWHARTADDQFRDHRAVTFDTACYSATGCLATIVDRGAGGLTDAANLRLFSFDPAGGAHAFHDTSVSAGIDVTCAQGTCVAGAPGAWLQSSDPAAGRSWRRVKRPRFDVTCLNGDRRCVALADGPFSGVAGPDLLVAPRRGGPWTAQTIDPGGQIVGVACLGSTGCVVVDQGGDLLAATRPGAGPSAWRVVATDPDGFNGVACEGHVGCVAVGGDGRAISGRP